ncbi:MAG: endopeptidase La [Elusimicrobia bacterium]|nr:MAG: endopeptidase La [Elusimicrobiota bacterium]
MRAAAGKSVTVPGAAFKVSPSGTGLLKPLSLTDLSSSLVVPALTTMSPSIGVALPQQTVQAAPQLMAVPKRIGLSPKTTVKSGVTIQSRGSVLQTLGKTMEGVTRSIEAGNLRTANSALDLFFEGNVFQLNGADAQVAPPDNAVGGNNNNGTMNNFPGEATIMGMSRLYLPGTHVSLTNIDQTSPPLHEALSKAAHEGKDNGYVILTSQNGMRGKEKTALLAKVTSDGPQIFILEVAARVEINSLKFRADSETSVGLIAAVREEHPAPIGDDLDAYYLVLSDIISDINEIAMTDPAAGDLYMELIDRDPADAVKILFDNMHVQAQHDIILFDSKLDQLKAIAQFFAMDKKAVKKQKQGADDLERRIQAAGLPEEVEKLVRKEAAGLEKSSGAEAQKIEQWLDFALELPWSKRTEDNLDLDHARAILDRDHFGIEKVKTRILEFLAVRKRLDNKKGAILLFTGPPGTGKTSIAKGIAEAMGREYIRIALGGVSTESKIRGHGRTYTGSKAGVILETIRRAGSKNPILVLDELEKMPPEGGGNGDPMAALLEVLDPEQNHAFTDHFLDLPFDLSEVLFIATANDLSRIPGPLRDRLEIIEFDGYMDSEKIQIGSQFLDPRGRKETGLTEAEATLPEEGLLHLIQHYTMEAGVRTLTRTIEGLFRKIVSNVETGKPAENVTLTPEVIDSLIGPAPVDHGKKSNNDVGVASALAVSGAGGSILPIEVNAFPNGKGKMEITGNLMETMNESARVAMTVVRSRAKQFNLDDVLFNTMDVHIHVPQGGTPKDGPSAGITLTTAIMSRLTGRPVKKRLAMTGEVYTNGEVHAIGGLREKVLGAFKQGYDTVLFPKENEKDVADIPKEIRELMTLISVDHIDLVLELALEKENTQEPLRVTKAGSQSWWSHPVFAVAAALTGVAAFLAGLNFWPF